MAVASNFVDACKIDGICAKRLAYTSSAVRSLLVFFTDSCAQRELACPLRPLLTRSVAWRVPHAHALNTGRMPHARHLACAPRGMG